MNDWLYCLGLTVACYLMQKQMVKQAPLPIYQIVGEKQRREEKRKDRERERERSASHSPLQVHTIT